MVFVLVFILPARHTVLTVCSEDNTGLFTASQPASTYSFFPHTINKGNFLFCMKLKKELEVQPDDPTDQTVFRFPHCSRRETLSVSGIKTNIQI